MNINAGSTTANAKGISTTGLTYVGEYYEISSAVYEIDNYSNKNNNAFVFEISYEGYIHRDNLKNSLEIAEILKSESKNRLVIVVSHDNELFEKIADRIITIDDGEIVSDKIININKTDKNFAYNKSNLSLNSAAVFSLKNIKKSPIRYCLTIISLVISLFIIIVGLNVFFNDESVSRKRLYDDYDLTYLNVLNGIKGVSHQTMGVSYEEYLKTKEKYDDVMLYVDDAVSSYILGTTSEYVYLCDEAKVDILYGSNIINDNEVIISDVMAYEIASNMNIEISNLIGYIKNKYFNISIAGIYDTPFNEIAKDYKSRINGDIVRTVFMTKSTLKNIDKLENDYKLQVLIGKDIYKLNVNVLDTLNNDEIIVPSSLNLSVGNNNFKYLNSKYLQTSHDSNYSLVESDYNTINLNVLSKTDENIMYVSEELFDKLYEMVLFYSGKQVGLLLDYYNIKIIRYFENEGYIFDTSIDGEIYYVLNIQKKSL